MKREANFQTQWNHWGKNVYKKNLFFELKQTRTDSLPFSDVKPHQIEGLLNVRHGVVAYKMVDCGYQNFCDGFFAVEQPAVIGIKYPKGVAIIPIDIFVMESKRSKRRSLTWERAKNLSTIEFA
jgi:penicillin-binding protein-related factor A (putative recombinase)